MLFKWNVPKWQPTKIIHGTCFWRSHLLLCCRACSVHCTSSASSHWPGPNRSWRDFWLLFLWTNRCWARPGLFCLGDIVDSTSSPSSATSDPAHPEALASSIGEGFFPLPVFDQTIFRTILVLLMLLWLFDEDYWSQRNCSVTHGNFSKRAICPIRGSFANTLLSKLSKKKINFGSTLQWWKWRTSLILVDFFGISAIAVLISSFRSSQSSL